MILGVAGDDLDVVGGEDFAEGDLVEGARLLHVVVDPRTVIPFGGVVLVFHLRAEAEFAVDDVEPVAGPPGLPAREAADDFLMEPPDGILDRLLRLALALEDFSPFEAGVEGRALDGVDDPADGSGNILFGDEGEIAHGGRC